MPYHTISHHTLPHTRTQTRTHTHSLTTVPVPIPEANGIQIRSDAGFGLGFSIRLVRVLGTSACLATSVEKTLEPLKPKPQPLCLI